MSLRLKKLPILIRVFELLLLILYAILKKIKQDMLGLERQEYFFSRFKFVADKIEEIIVVLHSYFIDKINTKITALK